MPARLSPSGLVRYYRCEGSNGCGLNFAAENEREADKWWDRHHAPFCPGNNWYTEQFKLEGDQAKLNEILARLR